MPSARILGKGETLHCKIPNFILSPATILAKQARGNDISTITVSGNDKLSHDAGSFLAQNPAIRSIKKSGNYGFDPVFRSFKYDRLAITLNGNGCATAACPNRMDPPTSQVPMNMVSSVEILKGPYSLRWGNAFGGTINFKTAKPEYPEQASVHGRLSSGYEGNGTILRSEGLLGINGKTYSLGLFGSYSTGMIILMATTKKYHQGSIGPAMVLICQHSLLHSKTFLFQLSITWQKMLISLH